MMGEKTGYPSIDKPWLKYYSEEAINAEIPTNSIYDQLCECNKDNLDGKAVSYFSVTLTYRELIRKIDTVAQAFIRLGIKTGDIVNVALPNIPENIYIVYGLNKIGAIANLIDLRSKGESLLHYFNETDATIAIICDLFAENIYEVLDKTLIKKTIIVSVFDSFPAFARVILKKRKNHPMNVIDWKHFMKLSDGKSCDSCGDEDNTAVILHTSGTTGVSKGVMLSNRSINAMAIQYKMSGMRYERGDVFLNQVPPFLAYCIVLALHLPFCLRMHLRLLPNYEPDKFASNISKYKPNHVVAGPADWGSFLDYEKVGKDYSFLKTLASGSDSMRTERKQAVNKLLASRGCQFQIMEGYGMTEVGSAACTNLPIHDVIGSVGVPLPLTTFCIWDNENEKELKYGELGEICISGPTAMKGYYGDDGDTINVLKVHPDGHTWIHTGDLGYIDEKGNVYFKGRLKRLIIRFDGRKISPFLIEDVMRTDKDVKECCAVGKPDNVHNRGAIPIVYIVLKEGADKDIVFERLQNTWKMKLKDLYDSAEYMAIDALPLTPNGKVDYRALEVWANEVNH